jgi:hypothetical protein
MPIPHFGARSRLLGRARRSEVEAACCDSQIDSIDIHPQACLASLILLLSCRQCGGHGPLPQPVGLSRLPPYCRSRLRMDHVGSDCAFHAGATARIVPALGSPIEPGAIEVVDGDTIRAGGRTFRLVGFDTPEMGSRSRCEHERALAAAASRRLRQLVAGGGLVACSCPLAQRRRWRAITGGCAAR